MKILVFLLVVGILIYAIAQAPLPAPLPPVSGSVPKITKEERFQANIIAVRRIKAATKNPDSFTLEYVMDTDDALCVTYRTTNASTKPFPDGRWSMTAKSSRLRSTGIDWGDAGTTGAQEGRRERDPRPRRPVILI